MLVSIREPGRSRRGLWLALVLAVLLFFLAYAFLVDSHAARPS